MKLNRSTLLMAMLPMLVIPLLQGCGSSKPRYSQPPQVKTDEPVPDLPEAHGEMEFTPAVDDKSAEAPKKTTEEDPVELATTDVAPSKRHPLCQDSHDPKKPQPEGVRCPRCQKGEFTQPEAKRPKLDILFVADSSPSLETERAAIAKGVRKFVDALPAETDYRFAVMAAHADHTYDNAKKTTGWAGKLLVAGNEPAVLKPADYKDWSKFNQVLAQKLTKIRSEGATDGGEVGLYSLDKGISEPLLSQNRALGFFRSDAALAVIFISDENDICSYEVNYPSGVTPKVNVNLYGKTGMTVEEKANEVYCRDSQGGRIDWARSVFQKLREVKSVPNSKTGEAMPLLVSGILYTEEATVPTVPAPDEKFPEFFTENEVGYGYLDIIRLNDGVAVDISKGNFDQGLRQIGEAAALKMEVKTAFQLKGDTKVDASTLCVLVDNRDARWVPDFEERVDGITYTYRSEFKEVLLRGVGATKKNGTSSKVEIFYCEPRSVIEFSPEQFPNFDMPTAGEHYRSLPIPNACQALKKAIQSGELDNND